MEPLAPYVLVEIEKWGKSFLCKSGISNYTKEIEWYLKIKFNLQKPYIFKEKKTLSKKQFNKYKKFIHRRAKQEPFQYILETAPFYGKDFFVNKNVLIPRPETETIINILKKKKIFFNHALDVGTGSGNLAITLILQKIAKKVTATDFSQKTLKVAKKNHKKFKLTNINFIKHNFLLDPCIGSQFDLVISNPPYVSLDDFNNLKPHIKNHEPKKALTDFNDGMTFYKEFANQAKTLLKPKGIMILEIGFNETKKIINNIFSNKGFTLTWHKDYNNSNRVLELKND